MGYTASWLFRGGRWTEDEPPEGGDQPWLHLFIDDSDVTTLHYHPADLGTGVAYLNTYWATNFEGDDEPPYNPNAAAHDLGQWFAAHSGGDAGAIAGRARQLLSDRYRFESKNEDELADWDIFVEPRTLELLAVGGVVAPRFFED